MGLYRQSDSFCDSSLCDSNPCDSIFDSIFDSIWCKLCSASCLFHVGDAYRQWGLGALLSNNKGLLPQYCCRWSRFEECYSVCNASLSGMYHIRGQNTELWSKIEWLPWSLGRKNLEDRFCKAFGCVDSHDNEILVSRNQASGNVCWSYVWTWGSDVIRTYYWELAAHDAGSGKWGTRFGSNESSTRRERLTARSSVQLTPTGRGRMIGMIAR